MALLGHAIEEMRSEAKEPATGTAWWRDSCERINQSGAVIFPRVPEFYFAEHNLSGTRAGTIRGGEDFFRRKNYGAKTMFAIKNWEKIRMVIGNEILLESCQNSVENQGWLHRIKQTLESNKMLNVYDEVPNSVYPFVYKKFFKSLRKIFTKQHFIKLNLNLAN